MTGTNRREPLDDDGPGRLINEQVKGPLVGSPASPADAVQVGGRHYKDVPIQPWAVIDTWPLEQRIGFYRGNLLKYTMRMGTKDASEVDIRKAGHYAQKLADVLALGNAMPAQGADDLELAGQPGAGAAKGERPRGPTDMSYAEFARDLRRLADELESGRYKHVNGGMDIALNGSGDCLTVTADLELQRAVPVDHALWAPPGLRAVEWPHATRLGDRCRQCVLRGAAACKTTPCQSRTEDMAHPSGKAVYFVRAVS